MSAKTATLVGATGLIGGELLKLLLDDPYYQIVRILIRRPFELPHPKLEKKLVDFNDADSLLVALDGSDTVFIAVGTTQRKVKGDKQAYRKVDYDIPVNIARYSKMVGCKDLVLVSSVGANSKSNNFYLKLKCEVENEIMKMEIESVHIMQPSMLLGKRNESRPLEKIGQPMMKVFSFLLPTKYKPIPARVVAKAMLKASKKNEKGVFVYGYKDMMVMSHR
jgi:uncharacterized protein YbjT (DUF2867 family)